MTRTVLPPAEAIPETIEELCRMLSEGKTPAAADFAEANLPFENQIPAKRTYSDTTKLRIFLRDGFIDRYSGGKLVFPGTLFLISDLLPTEIPYQRNWKLTECHILYWKIYPTIDHIAPISRGGGDSSDNLVCTSMLRNSAKANWTLEELGWSLHHPGDMAEWDGLVGWFLDFTSSNKKLLNIPLIAKWSHILDRALSHG